VSEPLDEARGCWMEVPQGQMIEVRDGKVRQTAFLSDEELVEA
jgi:predicted glutamine amidotransferase